MAFEELVSGRAKGPRATKWEDGVRSKKKQTKEDKAPFEFHDQTDQSGWDRPEKK